MFNVGVHMLSIAGEHLLVQICFMFLCPFVLLLFVLGVLSTIQKGGGTATTRPAQIHGYGLQDHMKQHTHKIRTDTECSQELLLAANEEADWVKWD